MSTYGDLRPEIERNFGNRTDADSALIIKANFNHAQRVLARAHPWRELEVKATPSLVAGQQDYTFSNLSLINFRKHYSLVLQLTDKGKPLEYITPLKWDKEVTPYLQSATKGKPDVFTIWAKTFSFFRIPDSNYTLIIRYCKYPSAVTGDSSIIEFDDVDDLLVCLTVAFCFLSIEEYELAGIWERSAIKLLQAYSREDLSITDLKFLEKKHIVRPDYWKDPFQKTQP